jgi:hypothetical protein
MRLVSNIKVACLCLFVVSCLNASSGHAQYFGNNAFQVPLIGWMGFDTTTGFANTDPWQVTDQPQIGFGYMRALVGYKLWLTAQSAVGFGYNRNPNLLASQLVVSLNLSSGLRYNFLDRRIRPFVAGQIEYLQFFNDGGRYKAWAGLLAGPGIEWIFGKDMGISLETGAHALFDFLNPARFSWSARLSYMLYF